ncbi:MAG: glycosyltransferase family 39 protein [Myxococcaceae bacterium]
MSTPTATFAPEALAPTSAASAIPLRAWVVLGPLTLAPILLAALQLGRWHPDEVYQFLEPAWFRVHGYGVRAWEWKVGLRNWSVPLVFSWMLQLAQALGITHPQAYRALIALPQLVLHGAMMVAVWRYSERRLGRAGLFPVAFATLLVGLYAPTILFAGRTMGESLSAAFLVLAFERLDRLSESRADGLAAGLWLGLSVVARYGSAVFVIAALVWLAWARRGRLLAFTCASGAAVAAGLAALDWATWGKPFHSLLAYLEFNVSSGRAAQQFGASPAWYYLPLLGAWVAVWIWPGLVAAIVRERRLPLPVFSALCYVVSISATAHKEERFLYPAWILLALVAAPATVELLARLRFAWMKAAGGALAVALGLVMFGWAPDFRGDQFRALVQATRDPEASGLLIVNEGLWGSGGHFYIGRDIPWYNCDTPQHALQILRADRRVNRVITFEDRALAELEQYGFQVVDRIGREAILERR